MSDEEKQRAKWLLKDFADFLARKTPPHTICYQSPRKKRLFGLSLAEEEKLIDEFISSKYD